MVARSNTKQSGLRFALLVLLSLLVSGCSGTVQTVPLYKELLYELSEFHYAQPIVHDGAAVPANLDALPFGNATLSAHATQPLVKGGGSRFGVTANRSIFATGGDHEHSTVGDNRHVLRSRDFGVTWQSVLNLSDFRHGGAVSGFGFPTLWVDRETDRIFVFDWAFIPAGLAYEGCGDLFVSDDDGESWQHSYTCPAGGAALGPGDPGLLELRGDGIYPWFDTSLFTAPRGPSSVQPALPTDWTKVLYLCYSRYLADAPAHLATNFVWLGTYCSTSYDAGVTWTRHSLVALPPAHRLILVGKLPMPEDCGLYSSIPAVHPDGTIALPMMSRGPACPQGVRIAVSEDDGFSWSLRTFEGELNAGSKPYRAEDSDDDHPSTTAAGALYDVAFGPNGTAHLAVRAADGLLYSLRSKDKFESWETPHRISPPGITWTSAAIAILVGDEDRVTVAHVSTTADMDTTLHAEPGNKTGNAHWHLLLTSSFNALADNPLYVSQQVTATEDPFHVGSAWSGAGLFTRLPGRAVDDDGRQYFFNIDSCTRRNGCTGDPDAAQAQSLDNQWALTVQDSGPSLYSEKGLLPPLGLRDPPPFPLGSGSAS